MRVPEAYSMNPTLNCSTRIDRWKRSTESRQNLIVEVIRVKGGCVWLGHEKAGQQVQMRVHAQMQMQMQTGVFGQAKMHLFGTTDLTKSYYIDVRMFLFY